MSARQAAARFEAQVFEKKITRPTTPFWRRLFRWRR